MSPDTANGRAATRRRVRFLPPIAGGEKKTGWEDLDKWVGSGGASASGGAASAGGGKKTGWEDLDKWVGSGGGTAAGAAAAGAADEATGAARGSASGTTGWEDLDKWVGSGGSTAADAAAAGAGGAAATGSGQGPAEPAPAPEESSDGDGAAAVMFGGISGLGWGLGVATLVGGLIFAFGHLGGAWGERFDYDAVRAAAGEVPEAGVDEDGDGLDEAGEAAVGSDPTVADTDGDGVSDGDEVGAGFDPTDPDDPSPAGSAGAGDGAAAGGDPEFESGDCTLAADTTQLTLDNETASALENAGIAVAPIVPATSSGGVVSFPVRTSLRVNCDNLGRIIGHRGGLRFTSADGASIETRRYRVDTQTSLMRAFPRSSGFDDAVEAFTVDLAGADVIRGEDDSLTLDTVDATLTAEGAAWLNDALGVDTFSEGLAIGTLSIR